MPYIGKEVTAGQTETVKDSFNGDNSTTAFTMSQSVSLDTDIEVFVGNVQQEPGSGKAYTVSGTTLTFSEAQPTGTGNIYVIHRNSLQGTLLPPQNLGDRNYLIGGNLSLDADSAVLNFGADSDINLTHVADTALLLNDAIKLTFRDSALSVNSSTDGQLDIDADAEVEITAPIVDINASTRVDISGDLTVGDDLTLGSDGAILNFGADSDINITHVADTGLTTNGDFTVGDDLTISGGVVDVKNTGSQSVVRFYCESSNAHYTEIQAAAHSDYSGNVPVTLPVTAGTLATTATAADEATALAIALG